MSTVTPPRKPAFLRWAPPDGEFVSIATEGFLSQLIANWQPYGQRASIFAQSDHDREVRVVSLGDDGWILLVREPQMQRWGWPAATMVSQLTQSGEVHTNGAWYMPDEKSDLAGGMFVAGNIMTSPTIVAKIAWAWMMRLPFPRWYVLDRTSFDPIPCVSVSDAFRKIPAEAFEWPRETQYAVIAFADDLGVARTLLMNPRSILVQLAGTDRRIRFNLRKDNTVRVPGLVDDLGHKYTISLPSGNVVRRERPPPTQPRAEDGTVTALRPTNRDTDV